MAEVSRNAAIEIARRTEKNLQFIRAEFDRLGEDSPVHVVTQLVNSLLGMVILPREQYLELRNEVTKLEQLVSEGWPEWDVTKGKANTLGVCPRIRSWRRKPSRNNLLTVIWTLLWSN